MRCDNGPAGGPQARGYGNIIGQFERGRRSPRSHRPNMAWARLGRVRYGSQRPKLLEPTNSDADRGLRPESRGRWIKAF
eukprot:4648954-Pyramimonas_sp.AAC.2